jgi:hypothetical protein
MKNIILTLTAILTIAVLANAQIIEDDFEFYDLGDMGIQNPSIWSVWNGDPEAGGGITVVDLGGGNQGGFIGPGSLQDALLLLGNITSGTYFIWFDMFISAGSTGYFNIQGETETNAVTGYEGAGNGGSGVFNSGNLYFNQDGAAPGVFEDDATGDTGTYPEDEWFFVEIFADLDQLIYVISINSTIVHDNPVPFQGDATLGAIDFFSIDANNNYWIDNVLFTEVFIDAVDDFSAANFKLYPNPVNDVLNIQSATVIDEIEVYNLLGKRVMEATPNAISPSLDMSTLSSGMYLVNVTIDETSKTFKVVK